MTLEEKVAQLGSVWAFQLVGGDGLDASAPREPRRRRHRRDHAARRRPPTSARRRRASGNEIQRYLVEETRLGIPAIIHEECLHGLLACDAPCFQQSIGAAAAFDPALVEAWPTRSDRRMLATGARHALAPVLDIAPRPALGPHRGDVRRGPVPRGRDGLRLHPRRSRATSLATGVVATAKHMVGHGLAEGGLNQAPAHVGPRELRDEQLFPFEAAVREAGIGSVMPAYCDVDGVPCHASRELLTTILRDEWGFDGVVASDYTGAPTCSSTQHRLTPSLGTAAALALAAGVDLELPRQPGLYGAPLLAALEDGRRRRGARWTAPWRGCCG